MANVLYRTILPATLFVIFSLCTHRIDAQQQTQQQPAVVAQQQPAVVAQQQPAVVAQPTSDVQDRTSMAYSPPVYDYTYLTKPYGYSAYRSYDNTQTQQHGYSNTGYGSTGYGSTGYGSTGYGSSGLSNYGGISGLISSIWPLILLPFIIFIGLSIFFPLAVQYPSQWGSRRTTSEPADEASFILQSVLHAIEHDKCLEKTACDLGLYSRHLGSSKTTVLGFVEKFAPSTVLPFMEIMRKAANHKGDTKDFCDRYNCDSTKAE